MTSGGKKPPSPPAAPTIPAAAPTLSGNQTGTSLNTAPVAKPSTSHVRQHTVSAGIDS